jgi:hypothetical protein
MIVAKSVTWGQVQHAATPANKALPGFHTRSQFRLLTDTPRLAENPPSNISSTEIVGITHLTEGSSHCLDQLPINSHELWPALEFKVYNAKLDMSDNVIRNRSFVSETQKTNLRFASIMTH